MPKQNKTKKTDYDKQFGCKYYELNKQILICDQMLQDKKSDKEIKMTCEKIGKLCKEIRKILEKKHGTSCLDKMREKNLDDAKTYLSLDNFLKNLFIECLPNNKLNKKSLKKLLEPNVSGLRKRNFSVILAKKLPDLKSEKPKIFKNKQEYVDYIKSIIKIYGADETKKSKLYNLLGQWYSAKYELDYYIKRVLERRKNDWGTITTGLSLLNWYCNSNIYTKVLLFVGGYMAPYISDAFYYLVYGKDCQKFELFKPSMYARKFDNRSVDIAIKYLQTEIDKLQQQLKRSKLYGVTSDILSSISRGCGSLFTDEISNSALSFFGSSNWISKICGTDMVTNMMKGVPMHNC